MKNNIPACPSHLVPKGNMIWVSLLTLVRNLTTIFNFQELLPVLIILSSWCPFRYFFFLMQYPLEFFLCRHRFDVIIFLLLILSNFSASQMLCVCVCVLCILLSPCVVEVILACLFILTGTKSLEGRLLVVGVDLDSTDSPHTFDP